MKLIESNKTAVACVILHSDFANVGNWVFFADQDQAELFAEEEGGRVVDEDGLAEKFEAMHCAEGCIPNQSSSGRFSETPEDADDDWQEKEWAAEYAESAATAFKDADVFEIEEEEVEPTKPEKLFVKIYPDGINVEDEDGNVLKTGTLDEHAEFVAWAKTQASEVEYDS